MIAILWVDDITIAGSNTDILMRLKMKDLGVLSWFLGIQFKCENDCIEMSTSKFVEKILERFKMSHCRPKAVPCGLGANKASTVNELKFENVNLYREIVGSLIYLMTCTRPDLCYVVTYLSQHLSKPMKSHYGMAKQALRDLTGTYNRCLKLS